MRKKIAAFLVVFSLAFILGGAFVAENNNLDLNTAFQFTDKAEVSAEDHDITYASTDPGECKVQSVADIVEQAGPAVVNIEAECTVSNPLLDDPFFRQFFGDRLKASPQVQTSIGTGFIITSDGYIVTNQHVINGARSIKVTVSGHKDKYEAQVIGQDYDLDLAVLKIEGNGYPTLVLGDSDAMRVGDPVLAIGQPYGLDHTVTVGYISAKERPITIEDRNYKNLIQTDAAINPGNSGGPLLNMMGQVIGINTAVNASAQGIGFAISIDTVSEVLDDLLAGKSIAKPFIGVSMTDVTREIAQRMGLPAESSGALIVEIVSGSAAEAAGLLPMDVIVGIDDIKISSASDVEDAVKVKEVGEKVNIKLIRQGNTITLPLELQAKS